MRKVALIAVLLTAVSLISICATSTVIHSLDRTIHRVVYSWQQPDDIVYDGPTYYLSVVERGNRQWRGYFMSNTQRYYIYVGRDSGQPGYGHFIDFSFHPFPNTVEEHIRQSTTEWTAEGVTFTTPSGHRLFIPERMFTGGR